MIHRICGSRKEEVGCYRFLNNKHVELSSLIEATCSSWVSGFSGSISSSGHYLVASDNTSLDWDTHAGQLKVNDPDLGFLEKNGVGFFVHPSLVIQADNGFPVGLSNLELFNRRFGAKDKHERSYRDQPYSEKESYYWYKGLDASQQRLSTLACHFTYVMDREADIYALFCGARDQNADYLIRSARERLLIHQGEKMALSQLLGQIEVQAQIEVDIPRAKDRKARQAQLEVSFTPVELLKPQKHADKALIRSVPIYLVNVKETAKTVPKGEVPIHWTLWTTHPVESLEEALEVVKWYRYRWLIEELFGLLKTRGLDIEASQLETGCALKKLTVMALSAALRILQLTKGRDQHDQEAKLIFDEQEILCLEVINPTLEGKTQKQKNPYLNSSLPWAAWIIARLGAWKGYDSNGKPGTKTMARGVMKFNNMFQAWKIMFQT